MGDVNLAERDVVGVSYAKELRQCHHPHKEGMLGPNRGPLLRLPSGRASVLDESNNYARTRTFVRYVRAVAYELHKVCRVVPARAQECIGRRKELVSWQLLARIQ